MEPNWVGVLEDEFIRVHTVDGGRAADADLLATHESSHEVCLALLFGGALGGGEFFFGLAMVLTSRGSLRLVFLHLLNVESGGTAALDSDSKNGADGGCPPTSCYAFPIRAQKC
jgi:hypothetical protein